MKKEFKFQLEGFARLIESHEYGMVIGRAEYVNSENQYLIRYKAGDGRQTETWWGESGLEPYDG